MPWTRLRYRGNKVWVLTDEAGAPELDQRGLASVRYKPEDDRTYSVRPAEIVPLEDTEALPGLAASEAPSAPEAAPAPTEPAPPEDPPVVPAEPLPAPEPAPSDEPAVPLPPSPNLEPDAIHVYTDGASSGNPGPAGLGVVLIWRGHRKELARWLGETTNNEAELAAVLAGLQAVRRPEVPVRVHTDSDYVLGVLVRGNKVKANADLVERIREQIARFRDLRFLKVAAHAGVVENERADHLASAASKGKNLG